MPFDRLKRREFIALLFGGTVNAGLAHISSIGHRSPYLIMPAPDTECLQIFLQHDQDVEQRAAEQGGVEVIVCGL